MGKFNRSERSGGDFKKRSFNRGDRPDRGGFGARPSMHQAVCSDCGKTCEVPFRPTGDKPVFCNDCFRDKRDGGYKSQSQFNSRPARIAQPTFSPSISNEQFEQLNSKLDQIIKLIFAGNKSDAFLEKEKPAKTAKETVSKKSAVKAKPSKAIKAKKKK